MLACNQLFYSIGDEIKHVWIYMRFGKSFICVYESTSYDTEEKD
jgi:hypothetical protein